MPSPSASAVTIIIPARLGSTRFPAKVLADKTGKPLIQHVYEAAKQARCAGRVVIATDNDRVMAAARNFGGEAVMTRADHPNGTSRLAEAAAALGLGPDSIVVNVQGDEPELEPSVIDAAVNALVSSGSPMATVASRFAPVASGGDDPSNPNIVKVVLSAKGTALYFSRALIPFDRDGKRESAPLRHVGLYVYRRSFLDAYLALPSTPLEKCEQLEQLRVLEHGYQIAVAIVESAQAGIDTEEQYESFVKRWKGK
jgi:3-deoxy-manno-octulosonate cytidylyltransferase (CMP-KDO synthetase)